MEDFRTILRQLDRIDITLRPHCVKISLPSVKGSCRNCIPHTLHDLLEIVHVVPSQKHSSDHLIGAEDMMQIGARLVAAGWTGAVFVQRPRIVSMSRMLDVYGAAMREHLPRAARA